LCEKMNPLVIERSRGLRPPGRLSAYVFNFLRVFCETTRWGGQRIVAISMRF
jgi:hypothetical protein